MSQPKIEFTNVDLSVPPYELYQRLRVGTERSFILESAVGADRTVAYSFMGFDPKDVYTCRNGVVDGNDELDGPLDEPLELLRSLARPITDDLRFPFSGGLVGYFSYEFAGLVEPTARSTVPSDFPDFELGRYNECIIYDHSNFRVYHASIDGQKDLLDRISSLPEMEQKTFTTTEPVSMMTQEEFEDGVIEIKKKIIEGETFQTVLSRRLEATYSGDPLKYYGVLRSISPSPYMFYIDFGGRKVLGSSPETLLTVRGREATTYPIAGTRPLGNGTVERRRNREEMLLDEKERAEHCMLVDLARNDLGKVCEGGSVNVPEFMRVEEYSHVQHIVSKVQGVVQRGISSVDALCAVFPAGTVSGAPKPRSMEMIADIEKVPRGPYAGGVGYLSYNGDLDTAITIRSAFISDDKIYFQAGAGIVADSDPTNEYLETGHKLNGMLAALKRSE